MYKKRVEHFKAMFPEKNCIGGITTNSIHSNTVGSPCMANIRPFSPKISDIDEIYKVRIEQLMSGPENTIDGRKILFANNLYDIDVHAARDLIRSSVKEIELVIPFNLDRNRDNFVGLITSSDNIFFNATKPLIFDDNKYMNIDTDELDDNDSPDKLLDILINDLKEFRYVNIVIDDIYESNKSIVRKLLKSIMSKLFKIYKAKVCIYNTNLVQSSSILLNVVSISSYKLKDMIPIFDAKHTDGIGIEIEISNSCIDCKSSISKSCVYRFVFSKSRDNILIIDGESIKRPLDMPVMDCIEPALAKLLLNTPNNKVSKLKQIATGDMICAE